MVITSEQHKAKLEAAELEIRGNLKVGAVDVYVDGDTALEYLGEIIRLNSLPAEKFETTRDWLDRIASELDSYIHKIIGEVVENNVEHVAQDMSEGKDNARN